MISAKLHGSALDGRTARHAGYAVSQKVRKRVEEIFGWMKTVGACGGLVIAASTAPGLACDGGPPG